MYTCNQVIKCVYIYIYIYIYTPTYINKYLLHIYICVCVYVKLTVRHFLKMQLYFDFYKPSMD